MWAASLQVAPVNIEVSGSGTASNLTLRNEGTAPLNAQVRVFRWSQVNGQENLEPTDDVVASPPIVSLAPSVDYTVRIVRVTKRALVAGENYRLLVDEIPDLRAQRNGVIRLAMRYSIPVFFYSREISAANLTWSITHQGKQAYVSATNSGDRHVRISALTLRDAIGAVGTFGNGLTGYVLGRSTMRWIIPGNTQRLSANSLVVISANGDSGPIHASVSVSPPR